MTQLNKIFEILHNSDRASKFALDLENRELFPTIAVVTNNKDPDNQRRIKVALPASPGLESDWIRPLQTSPNLDPPLPQIGSTVLYLSVDGTLNNWYLNCINDTNPPLEKEDPVNDHRERTPGKRILDVVKDFAIKVLKNLFIDADGNINIKAGKKVTISNTAGASLTLHEAGVAILSDNLGNTIVLGGSTNGLGYSSDLIWEIQTGNIRFNLNGNAVEFLNAGNVSINSKSVTTLTATDSRGDTLVTRGY
jgi:hypothetical protein